MSYKSYGRIKNLQKALAEAETLEINPFENYDLGTYPKQFIILKKVWPHLNIKHNVTKEHKWVNIFDIEQEGIENAFYDVDHQFCPKNVLKKGITYG